MLKYVNGVVELMNYTELINIFNYRNDYGANMWTFDKITFHRKLT